MNAILWTDESFRAKVRDRSSPGCSVLQHQLLPIGFSPRTGRLGVEHTGDGAVLLHVDRAAVYRGLDEDLLEWSSIGTRAFPTADALLAWWDRYQPAPQHRTPSVPTELDDVVVPRDVPTPTIVEVSALSEVLGSDIVGQDASLREIARHVRSHLARVAPTRPLSLYFLGPTGVGKTATAEALAGAIHQLTGEPTSFLRLDMNEYREAHRVAQFLGAPPGYVGHGLASPLLDVLSNGQRAVVLFDEIDKGHPDVLLTIMGALDAGRFTDPSSSDPVSCRRAIFLFTSNEQALDTGDPARAPSDTQAIQRSLITAGARPEIIARMQAFIEFGPLSPDGIAAAATLAIVRLGTTFGLDVVHVHPDVVSLVLQRVGTSSLGVRAYEYEASRSLSDAFIAFTEGARVPARVTVSLDGYGIAQVAGSGTSTS